MVDLWTVVLLLLVGGAPQPDNQSSSFCACLTADATVKGLAQLRDANWRAIDRTEVTKLWPRVPLLPCDPGPPQPGLEAAADHLARCCAACELCGGVAFDEPGTGGTNGSRPSFRLVDVWLSRQTFDSSKGILAALTTAALPRGLKPTSASHSESRIIDAYTWGSDGVQFQMRVDAIASGSVWVGHFQVGLCSSSGPTESWRVGGDKAIPVLSAEAAESPGQGTVLSLSFATQCLLEDRACWTAELDQLWPRLQSLAAGRAIAAADIEVEGCLGSSVSFQVTRSTDGRWAGVWTPKTR